MYQTEKEYLLELGMKDKLLGYLNETQIAKLAEYALDHHHHPDLLKVLIAIASLERRGKIGAIELVANGIITPLQAKSLEQKQIIEVLKTYHTAEYDHEFNVRSARIFAKQCIVENQQKKINKETGEPIFELYEDYVEHHHQHDRNR